jgi:MurNAc alpha-1-phosphate uridylyltransferase
VKIDTAMVLAAGLGTRMRPLTDDRPKALVEVGGKALIDHMLDRLAEARVGRAVVNVHYCADRLEAHLRGRKQPTVTISDERGLLLETGGGLKKARPLLGDEAILVANIDSIWTEAGVPAIERLVRAWDPAAMDALLLVVPLTNGLGFEGPGDFFQGDDGRLTFRGAAAAAPFAFMGVHVTKPQVVDAEADGPFSLSKVWRRLAAEKRLYGVAFDGFWMHVGDPQARDAAEARLRETA